VWTLEQPDWLSTYGDTALGFTNLGTQPSWSDAGTALSVDTNGVAWLDLYVYEPYGWTNVVFDEGTLSFWYQANWTSVADGGTGPTNWASLLNIGQWSSSAEESCWSLVIDPSGSNLLFLAQSNGNQQAISVPIDFDAGDWHNVVLTYSPTDFALYLEGQSVTNTSPITNWPSDGICSNGMFVGSDATGVFQGRGQFQSLQTYGYLLNAGEIAQNYSDISSIILNWGATVPGSGGFYTDSDPPSPGGGGGGGGGGGVPEGLTNSIPIPDYTTNQFWLQPLPLGTNAYNLNPNALTFILWDTTNTSSYQLSTTTNLASSVWTPQPVFIGSSGQNWTPITFPVAGQTALFFEAINYSQDTTDSGLPDWWKIQNGLNPNVLSSSTNGVSDAYADPAGDGWTDLQKFENGMNINTFYTPPAPMVTVAPLAGDNGVLVTWEPSLGNVTGYTIYRNGSPLTTVSSSYTSYQDNSVSVSPYSMPTYQVQANYALGDSSLSLPQSPQNQSMSVDTLLIRGSQGNYYLVAPNIPNTITNLRIYAFASSSEYPNIMFDIYSQPMTNFNSGASAEYLDFPSVNFTNGYALMPQTFIPYYNAFSLACVPMGSNGTFGPFTYVNSAFFQFSATGFNWYNAEEGSLQTQINGLWGNLTPFLDGTTQLRQNLVFQLESAEEDNALVFSIDSIGDTRPTVYPMNGYSDDFFLPNYAWANFHMRDGNTVGLVHELKPFEDNYFYRNMVVDSTGDLNPNGSMLSGIYCTGGSPSSPPPPYNVEDSIQIPNHVPFAFPDYAFAESGTTSPPATLLSTNAQLIFSPWPSQGFIGASYVTPTNLSLATGQKNLFGLPYQSITEYYSDGTSLFSETVTPGQTVLDVAAYSNYNSFFYAEVQAPTLHTAGYYFAQTDRDLLPGDVGFAPTTNSGLFITSAGTPLLLGAWAEQSVDGSTNAPGFIEQYFDSASALNDSGAPTTNQTGILSEYGEFFPTDPGAVELTTKTNADGDSGSVEVQVIGLYADRNHDGVIDTRFSGPDFCTPSRPFQFWFNDDDDSGDTAGDDIPGRPASVGKTPNGVSGMVNGTRDLTDFFPVYVDIDSIVDAPNTNYIYLSYRLSQADSALNFLYTTLDTNAPLQYLTDTNIASRYSSALVTQITSNGVSIVPGITGGALNFGIILVEAWTNTTAPLVLDVLEGTNVIAEAQLPLNITSVEQMFRHKNLTASVLGAIDGPPDRLTYADVPNELDSNGTNFIFIHGYNVNADQARGWESEVYKRMYWSGSHARFYGVTWDGYDTQVEGKVSISLHTNEIHAFQTAPALTTFLASLSGPNFTAAHSLGNMLVLAALNDHHATISSHFMIDGAVALESVDGPEGVNLDMVPPDWTNYLSGTWAGEFFNLFPTNDYRSTLTWSNRLVNFNGAKVYNFYSSGEEVLRNDPSPPLDLVGLAISDIINSVWDAQPFAANLWCLSQKEKGRMLSDLALGSYHGGWGYNTAYGSLNLPPNSSVVNALTSSQLITNPVFDVEVDTPLYQTGAAGSVYAQANQTSILSFAIPALTYAAGANFVTSLTSPGDQRNFDMQGDFETGWPASRSTGSEAFYWYHSDCREVAYLYTHELFDELVTLGNLK
jgi:hypothetical protein